ncbi:MAG: ABC transporter permease [Verrucomicrobiales bacterium]|nr:ABC transporter permease [Verrucomicrobiales bacterium]
MLEPITISHLLVLLLPLILVAVIYWKWVGRPAEIGVATGRMVLQLLAVGYFLAYLFESESPWVGLAVLFFMMAISSWIAMRSTKKRSWQTYRRLLTSIVLAGSLNLALVVFFVLRLDPWYQLRAMIPIAGMIFSTGMNVVSLCAERYETEMEGGGDHESARKAAFRASLIPQVNSFLAVGLVALPGMMTGQILAGVSPLDAVRYQIMVMCMIMGTAGLAAAIYLCLVRPSKEPS